jgi:hypothetical protein
MSTIQERMDGCEKCIDGRIAIMIDDKIVANTICDCKLRKCETHGRT